jgi:hypothetical protein
MSKFSKIELSFEDFIKSYENEKRLEATKPAPPFSEIEMTEERKLKRRNKALQDFWFFDKTYFSAEMYEDYAEPNKMLKDIVAFASVPGIHIVLGPRQHGKTITAKKLLIWLALSGKAKILGTYAETLPKSSAILKDVFTICMNNEKIMFDFGIKFHEANSDQLSFSSEVNKATDLRFIASFSEGRSVRGYTRLFGRPSFILADDIETNESSFTSKSVVLRIKKLSETFHSMSKNATFLILANDFDTSSAIHQLRLQYEQKLLHPSFNVHVYKAWQNNRPLWKKRYNAESEQELKNLIKPFSESDWQANYQQNPIPPEGDFFVRQFYDEALTPSDVKCVIYCDPNLSKKGKGDTTAIVVFGYSIQYDKYYIVDAICKSYSDSNLLLNDILTLKYRYPNIYAIAFDGHVSQESTWTQHVKNYCKQSNMPYPAIEYKRYKVNDLAKNFQLVYNEQRISFPIAFSRTENGERFLNQFFSFSGTKETNKDDAPDSLICAFEFLHERKLAKKVKPKPAIAIKDYYYL